jgi:hypothetical protein
MPKPTRGNGSHDGEQVEIFRAIWNEIKALKASLESQLLVLL